MKKNLFYLFALICSMSLFTACSDDDKPGGSGEGGVTLEEVITNDIAGNYKGDLAVTVLGVPMEPVAQKVAVTKSGTEAVSLSINNFSFLGMSLGDIKLENCALAEENGAYTFTGTTSLDVTPVPGMNLTADVAAEGSFTTGNPTSITLNLDIKAELAGQQQDVTVVYTGTRLTGNESSEALITSFAIDSELVSEAPAIDNEAGTITFKVLDSAESLVFTPTIEVSAGATVSPASGEEQDFSSAVTYTVTAEDGTVKTYTVSVAAKQNIMAFSFDEWDVAEVGSAFLAYDIPLPSDMLATPNEGAKMLNGSSTENPVGYPVVVEEEGFSGKAAKLITRDARGTLAELGKAYITAGSIFTGKFAFDMWGALAPGGALKQTHFGVLYDKKPVKFSGMYKYTPGTPFIRTVEDEATETEEVDECAIQAVLYTVSSEDETLDGSNIDSDDARIVARARLEDGSEKAEWTPFELEFVWKDGASYDETLTYKLAIVCSSSKDGANFNGAANSTLWIDEFEVIGE